MSIQLTGKPFVMSAKNYITLFRALKSDYAYLISLMGFSWLSIYGYPGECKLYDVVATFSFLLILRCRYFHFLMLILISWYPIGHYPLVGLSGISADTIFELLYTNPLNSLTIMQGLSLTVIVPSLILLTLIVILTILQNNKTAGFNLLRLEFFIITCTIIGVTTLMNVIGGSTGWQWEYISYPPIKHIVSLLLML